MASSASPFRVAIASAAVVVVTAAALAAGTTIAGAAPTAPVITSPGDETPFTTNTISVSGNVQVNTDQTVTVWVDNDGSITTGCTVVVPYIESTFTCDVIVPGPGKYELTATSVDTFDPNPSPPSEPVTVLVGTTAPALMDFPESGTVWNTLTPVISGMGPALGEVSVEILWGEGSTTYCTVTEVPAAGSWSCSPPSSLGWSWTEVEFRAYGTDLTGTPTGDDAIIGEIRPAPPQTTLTLGPASVSFTATGSIDVDLETIAYDVFLNGEGSMFTEYQVCGSTGNPPVVACSLANLPAGDYNFSTVQEAAEVFIDTFSEFVRIPSAPTNFSATVLADRSVRFSGTGLPGDRAIVRTSGGSLVCTVIVPESSNWQCTVDLPAGTASYQALQQSVGFDANDDVPSDRSFDGFSALSAPRSVTVPPAPAPLPPTLSLVTPGLVEVSGLPPLATGGAQLEIVGNTDCVDPIVCDVDVDIFSTPQRLGSTVTEPAGAFSLVVTVPEEIEPGDHTIVVTVTPRGGVASSVSQPITIAAPIEIDAVKQSPESIAPDKSDAAATQDGGSSNSSGVDRADPASPSAISDSIPTIDRIFRSPLLILLSGGLALAILLLIAFPAELLNSTLASNTRRLGRWYAAVENGIDRATEWFASVTRTRAIAAAVMVVLTSLIFGFVDPDYGFDPVSLRMTISLAVGLFIVTYVASWISGAIIRRVWAIDTRVSLQPAALVFAVIGVIVARLLEFSPGFLIGLVIGLDIVSRVAAPYRVRAILTNIGVIVGLAVTAWLGFSLMSALMTGEPTMLSLLVSDALIATTAEGLTAALAALLPLGYLAGHEVFQLSKRLWAGTFAAVATVFSLIVLPTAEGETGDVADVGFWMLIMVIFAAVTLTLWAILHFTGRDDSDDDELVDEQSSRSAGVPR